MKMTMMKKNGALKKASILMLSAFVLTLLFSGFALFANTNNDGQHGKPLKVVLQEIREKLNLGPNDAINPRRVSDRDQEELGEAVMSVTFSDPEQHVIMDDMMGGEGSRRLARMHRRIGYRYLSGKGFGMMGGGMMGGMMGNQMMFFSFWRIIMWIILLAVIGVAVYFIVRAQRGNGKVLASFSETPIEIAKKRYARGEITREEYENISQNL